MCQQNHHHRNSSPYQAMRTFFAFQVWGEPKINCSDYNFFVACFHSFGGCVFVLLPCRHHNFEKYQILCNHKYLLTIISQCGCVSRIPTLCSGRALFFTFIDSPPPQYMIILYYCTLRIGMFLMLLCIM